MKVVALFALLSLPVSALDAQEQWALEEVLRIGAMEGERALSFIGPLALSGDGRAIAVSQPMDRNILLLNTATGERQRVLGRGSSGPGEFQQIGGISIAGDTLVAVDARQSRIVRFSLSTGAHIGTHRYHPQVHAGTGRVAWPLVKPTFFEYAPDGSTAGLAEPVADRRGEAGWKRVASFDHHGNVLFDRIYRGAPVPVTQEVQDSLVDWLASIAGRGGHAAAARPAAARELVVPRHHPAVQRLLVGDDRSVRIQGPGDPGAPPAWTVLDPHGTEMARVATPEGVELRLPTRACPFQAENASLLRGSDVASDHLRPRTHAPMMPIPPSRSGR